jgi:hypothetical protein
MVFYQLGSVIELGLSRKWIKAGESGLINYSINMLII